VQSGWPAAAAAAARSAAAGSQMRTVCADERGRAHDEGVLSGLRAPNLDATAATMGIMLAAWDTLILSVQAPRFPRPSSDHPNRRSLIVSFTTQIQTVAKAVTSGYG